MSDVHHCSYNFAFDRQAGYFPTVSSIPSMLPSFLNAIWTLCDYAEFGLSDAQRSFSAVATWTSTPFFRRGEEDSRVDLGRSSNPESYHLSLIHEADPFFFFGEHPLLLNRTLASYVFYFAPPSIAFSTGHIIRL